jgi:predicted dienelactone hydrolase
MEHWAPVFAEAGYLAVAIAHEGRDEASYQALCAELATNPDHPCSVKVSWDRPHDVRRVLDYLEAQNEGGPLAGAIDLTRVAHVGHSAGAGAALMSLGATRNFRCALPFGFEDPDQDCQVADLVSLAEPRIAVALSLSPQGPGNEGFMAESYEPVTKPFMMMTGANDGDPGEPENRRSIWPLLPTGNKYLLWIEDQGAKHTLFEGSVEACEPIAGANKCRAMRSAIFATGLAFIDAHLREVPAAAAWLGSGDLETAGGELFEYERK